MSLGASAHAGIAGHQRNAVHAHGKDHGLQAKARTGKGCLTPGVSRADDRNVDLIFDYFISLDVFRSLCHFFSLTLFYVRLLI